jgi:hypothetical protein
LDEVTILKFRERRKLALFGKRDIKMYMSLYIATMMMGLVVLVKGWVMYGGGEMGKRWWERVIGSRMVTVVSTGVATVWFMRNVMNLTEADFGEYRGILMVFFGLLGVAAVYTVKELLVVRALCVIWLLMAGVVLDAAYMEEAMGRLFLVSLVYLFIIGGLYFGTVPYRLRDFVNWMYGKRWRVRGVGLGFMVYGVVLLIVGLTY